MGIRRIRVGQSGEVAGEDLVWADDMDDWQPAADCAALWTTDMPEAPAAPMPAPVAPMPAPEPAPEAVFEPMAAGPATHPLAVVSFVLGVVSVFLCQFLIPEILAVVLGHVALRQIKANPDKYVGRRWALAGTVLGYLCLTLVVLAIIFVVVFLSNTRSLVGSWWRKCVSERGSVVELV